MRPHSLSVAGSPHRPPLRIALERAIEAIQTQLGALSERIELIELQSSGTRQTASPRDCQGPLVLLVDPATAFLGTSTKWDWAIVFKGMARVLASLRQLAVFLSDSEGRSPTFVVVRRLLLDISSILCALALAKTIWKRIGVRRRRVNAAIRALWWAGGQDTS